MSLKPVNNKQAVSVIKEPDWKGFGVSFEAQGGGGREADDTHTSRGKYVCF